MAVDNIARGMAAKALENQGGGGSSLPIVNTATVGQTIRVSAVDDAGKPTEWEAVDIVSGGGSVTKTLLFDGSAASDTTVTLSESFDNFDLLLMVCYVSGNVKYPYCTVIDCNSIALSGGWDSVFYGTTAFESSTKFNSCGFIFRTNKKDILFNSKASGWGAGTLGKVYGIKL